MHVWGSKQTFTIRPEMSGASTTIRVCQKRESKPRLTWVSIKYLGSQI